MPAKESSVAYRELPVRHEMDRKGGKEKIGRGGQKTLKSNKDTRSLDVNGSVDDSQSDSQSHNFLQDFHLLNAQQPRQPRCVQSVLWTGPEVEVSV